MIRKGAALLKPGTLLLFVFMAAFGFGVYSWASTSLIETREDSLNDQNNAIECSTLEISNAGIQTTENGVKLFFESNKDLEHVNVNF